MSSRHSYSLSPRSGERARVRGLRLPDDHLFAVRGGRRAAWGEAIRAPGGEERVGRFAVEVGGVVARDDGGHHEAVAPEATDHVKAGDAGQLADDRVAVG